jgi:hypothetical protein
MGDERPLCCLRDKFLTAATVYITASLNVTPCNLVDVRHIFEGTSVNAYHGVIFYKTVIFFSDFFRFLSCMYTENISGSSLDPVFPDATTSEHSQLDRVKYLTTCVSSTVYLHKISRSLQ